MKSLAASLLVLLILTISRFTWAGDAKSAIEFNRDVRPILADKCFPCHGPDSNTRQADLRLDDSDNVFRARDGYHILLPGQPDNSELYQRITTDDESLQMPPSDQERQLSPNEIITLKQWIEAGANYEPHWAFISPQRPPVPAVAKESWPLNPIDRFVLAHLEAHELRPSPPADKPSLIRRVTLDLTGLAPTPAEVAAFLADDTPGSYERVVDRLLASPRYGERMAQGWLDAARYADSGGYQGDILRNMWSWRDWVINAYNAGMPFDQFTIEQLAGDLLPNPTQEQLIATGFNRNHRINDEDGIILEEFRVEYVADRVETTGSVWMGLTFGCARCHDHKFDPISQPDYFRLFAYFNQVDEKGRGHGNAPPLLPLPTPEQQSKLDRLDGQLAALSEQQTAATTETAASVGETEGGTAVAEEIQSLTDQRQAVMNAVTTTMIMRDLPEPRTTHVLIRGSYDQTGEEVTAGVPQALSPLPHDAPKNRLALARWLVDGNHPLTARVAVNRYWQSLFGRGFVATPEDFGTQGELPSHPALLDWLATEFVRLGWDIKAVQRLIVTSATYQQSSTGSKELQRRDPENRLLARGPRFRMSAEMLRDQALSASGLLVERLGGPSVKPYQPPGLWKELTSATTTYEQDAGSDLYRRSLYTFIRRTVPPPAMAVMDAPNREICTVRRPRTNTPTQALALMNDPTYVEAARALAEDVVAHTEASTEQRLAQAFRRILSRTPTSAEQMVLSQTMDFYRQRYAADPVAAGQFVSVGESQPDSSLDATEVAALTAVVNLLMNLDETLTKE